MAGTKYGSFAVGDANIDNVMLQLAGVEIGFCALTLTEMTTTNVPQIAAGSKIEVGGSLFKFDANETITGSATTGTNYIRLVPSGSSITAAWTTTAPTWSDSKQGWYDGTGAYRYWPGIVVYATTYAKYKWVDPTINSLAVRNFSGTTPYVYGSFGTLSTLIANDINCGASLYSSPITAFSFGSTATVNFDVLYPMTLASTRAGQFYVYYSATDVAAMTNGAVPAITLMPGRYRFTNSIASTGTMYITGVFGYAATSSTGGYNLLQTF